MSLVPPATRDCWSYSGDFHVEVSGNNRHRRATVPELKAVFDGSDGSKDRPAHWYEAQLMHYGLPPSKTKGTAKMRLFDAVSKENLAVPAHILKVESDLKKEWTKRDREVKQLLKKSSTSATINPAQGSNKRKADSSATGLGPGTGINIGLNISFGPQGHVHVAPDEPVAKKAKTSKSKLSEVTPKTKGPSASAASAPKSSQKLPTAKESKFPAAPSAGLSTSTTGRTKQTARCGTSSARGAKSVSSRAKSDASSDKKTTPRTQMARCSRPYGRDTPGRSTAGTAQPSRSDTTPSQWELDMPDDPPPPYPGPGSSEHPYGGYNNDGGGNVHRNAAPLPPSLGLLNGRYRLRCTSPPDFADREHDSSVIFTLDGDALWGSFEIGPLSGVLRLSERPRQASTRPLVFEWCGEDAQGGQHSETDDGSYLVFLGGGEVKGEVGFYGNMLRFEGYRVSGQGTRSEVSAAEMRRQWGELWVG